MSWDREIGSVEGSLVGDKENPAVEGCTAQTEHRRSAGEGRVPAVVEESLPVGGKESLVGGMAILAVKCTVVEDTVVEGTARLVVEEMANPVAEKDKPTPGLVGTVVARGQAEDPPARIRPEVVETARAYGKG